MLFMYHDDRMILSRDKRGMGFMIYVFVALYPEAKPVIRRLGLKRERAEFGFDVYAADRHEIRLVITGTGMVNAATAVGSTLAHYHVGRNSENISLVNYGSCAGEGRTGEVCLCNKIIDRISGHTFYPDILYRHDLPESYVVSELNVLKEGLDDLHGEGLHDMEAAAVYQAGSRFLGPHQMSFIKVISDSGKGGEIGAEELTEIMETGSEVFSKYLLECIGRDAPADSEGQIFEKEFEQLCQQLHCSETMRIAVRQCIKYWSLAGVDYQTVLRQMREQKELPCRDRREGKKRFEELKRRLL